MGETGVGVTAVFWGSGTTLGRAGGWGHATCVVWERAICYCIVYMYKHLPCKALKGEWPQHTYAVSVLYVHVASP